jgi:hypothetical protein
MLATFVIFCCGNGVTKVEIQRITPADNAVDITASNPAFARTSKPVFMWVAINFPSPAETISTE